MSRLKEIQGAVGAIIVGVALMGCYLVWDIPALYVFGMCMVIGGVAAIGILALPWTDVELEETTESVKLVYELLKAIGLPMMGGRTNIDWSGVVVVSSPNAYAVDDELEDILDSDEAGCDWDHQEVFDEVLAWEHTTSTPLHYDADGNLCTCHGGSQNCVYRYVPVHIRPEVKSLLWRGVFNDDHVEFVFADTEREAHGILMEGKAEDHWSMISSLDVVVDIDDLYDEDELAEAVDMLRQFAIDNYRDHAIIQNGVVIAFDIPF